MKTTSLVLILAALLTSNAAIATTEGAGDLVKSCSVELNMEDSDGLNMLFEINKAGEGLAAVITSREQGEELVLTDTVVFAEHSIRPELTAESDTQELNQAEVLVVHAMMWVADPDLNKMAQLEIDLSQVRSASVYTIGESTSMGSTAIVEAYDSQGLALGSFLAGFLVGQCR